MTKPRWAQDDLRLLIVDDDVVDRKSIRRSLLAGGVSAEIVEASDAEQALTLLDADAFDAVLLDFNMPRRDGLWLVAQARGRGLRCPLIVLTGQGDEQIAVELMKAGATDYFSKATLTPERAARSLRHALRVADVEAALRESEERAQLAIEATQLGTWDLAPSSGRLRLSERGRALLRIGHDEEATYERFLASVHPRDKTHMQAAIARALESESGGAFDIEYRVATSSGEPDRDEERERSGQEEHSAQKQDSAQKEHWVRATGRAFFNELGKAIRFIGTLQDIDEQKQLEAQRASLLDAERTARERAEAASRVREDLVAIVSHDLRNPLSAISVSAEVLRTLSAPQPDPQTKRLLETILRSTTRMNRLISDLLDVASIEAGALSMRRERYEAAALLREAVEMMSPMAVEKSLLLESIPCSSGLAVLVDKERVLQIFSNLIGNAVKFTREGGHITLAARADGDSVTFSVSDTGQGLSEEHVQHVFDRYWQAQKEGRLGIGLGLSIVKGIVDAHQGKIWLKSSLGKGTTFHFTLPAATPK